MLFFLPLSALSCVFSLFICIWTSTRSFCAWCRRWDGFFLKARTRGGKGSTVTERKWHTKNIIYWSRTIRPCQNLWGCWQDVTGQKMRAGALCGIHSAGKRWHCPSGIPQALNRKFVPRSRGCVPRAVPCSTSPALWESGVSWEGTCVFSGAIWGLPDLVGMCQIFICHRKLQEQGF